MLSEKQITRFQKTILNWYAEHQRDLPWRQTRDPYRILISEIMSQQTQIARVIPKYNAWLQAFPTIADLAEAPVSEVLYYWSGLGYNRRALNLKKTAQIITETYQGKFPQTEKELVTLPGIGIYTARALLCFAFNQQVTVIDTNVRKVILIHFTVSEEDIPQVAEKLLPIGKAYEWNQALMDYAGVRLKDHKIPIPKQSKFVGSHRYFRGQVLKQLLQQKQIKLKALGKTIKKDFSEADQVMVDKVVAELVKEGFIVVSNKIVTLVT